MIDSSEKRDFSQRAQQTELEDEMQGQRLFTDEELKNMGRRNVDAVTEAIDSGDPDRAKDMAQRMHRESLAMHDGLINWITALLTYVGRQHGDEALCEALRESVNAWLAPLGETFANATARQRAVLMAKVMRGHMMPITIEEDDEKLTFIMEPCGSGGRLILEGKYDPPDGYLRIEKPQPITCGQEDFPVYCAHGPVISMLGIEAGGAPLFYEEPSDKLGETPCKVYMYKDPTAIPEELYAKVGKKKGS
jgi:hypothetical protein